MTNISLADVDEEKKSAPEQILGFALALGEQPAMCPHAAVSLCLLALLELRAGAAAIVAFSMALQRYALTCTEPKATPLGRLSPGALWATGIGLYAAGNGLYTASLVFGPMVRRPAPTLSVIIS
jgi:hypothetical protein